MAEAMQGICHERDQLVTNQLAQVFVGETPLGCIVKVPNARFQQHMPIRVDDGQIGLAEPFVESNVEMVHRWSCFLDVLQDHGGLVPIIPLGGFHSASARSPRTISSAILCQSMLPGCRCHCTISPCSVAMRIRACASTTISARNSPAAIPACSSWLSAETLRACRCLARSARTGMCWLRFQPSMSTRQASASACTCLPTGENEFNH